MSAYLEHANITVENAKLAAELFSRLFDWEIRWEGDSINGGRSVHVGSPSSYLAFYSPEELAKLEHSDTYTTKGAMNHIGVVVKDLDLVEQRIKGEGLDPHFYADYEPGKRFYVYLLDNIELEVVNYG